MNKKISEIRESFNNKALFDEALTHKSWVNENPKTRPSYERLEFLGDAVLELVISRELFEKYPGEDEGYLTALRSRLVNTANLAEVAKKLGVGEGMFLSKGEETTGGRENLYLLEDSLEAIIGAIYLDQGILEAGAFIKKNITPTLQKILSGPLKHPKSRLQEMAYTLEYGTPYYKVIKETGPDHDKNFEVEVRLEGKTWGKGQGKSKTLAEEEAAKVALVALEAREKV